MIRFSPDNWLDALVRPIGMAVPAGSIYTEIIAPDFRFVFVLALLLAWLAWRVRAHAAAARTLGLLAFVALSFVPWLATTGNGRYFMPTLLVVGPLCVAMLHHLPIPQRARLGGALLMVAVQVGLLHEVQPWSSWGLAPWTEAPAFGIDVPKDLRDTPATYVTITSVSYSLIAPSFHPDSRWINLTTQGVGPEDTPARRRTRELLESKPLYAVFPSVERTSKNLTILAEQADAFDIALADRQLRLDRPQCRLIPSRGLSNVGARLGDDLDKREPRGFWACPLLRAAPAAAPVKLEPSADVMAVIERVEKLCPRIFPTAGASTIIMPIGVRRFYPDADMRLYVTNEGQVVYKYMRALNAVVLGTKQQVMASGFHMDCNIRGRAGLPWEREI